MQEADEQASQTVRTVEELKKRICDIQNQECMSEQDNRELQAINGQLKTELVKLEKITRNVSNLNGTVRISAYHNYFQQH